MPVVTMVKNRWKAWLAWTMWTTLVAMVTWAVIQILNWMGEEKKKVEPKKKGQKDKETQTDWRNLEEVIPKAKAEEYLLTKFGACVHNMSECPCIQGRDLSSKRLCQWCQGASTRGAILAM